jgi:hypothetical protein
MDLGAGAARYHVSVGPSLEKPCYEEGGGLTWHILLVVAAVLERCRTAASVVSVAAARLVRRPVDGDLVRTP